MATVELTDDNLGETLDSNEIVIFDFWAGWCGPCQMFGPTFEEVSEKYPDILFGKVDTEKELKVSSYFHIRSIPTVLMIRDRIVVFEHSGVLGADDLVKVIEQVRGLNMEQVKQDVEKEEADKG